MLNVTANMLMRGDHILGMGEVTAISSQNGLVDAEIDQTYLNVFYPWEIVTLLTDEPKENYGF